MAELRTAPTAALDAATLAAAHALLVDAFAGEPDGDLTEQDWQHVLGGVHALVWEDGELIGHGAVVPRQLLHDGRALRSGYVEGVAVRADRRGQGHGAALMEALEAVVRREHAIGALSATDVAAPLYEARGWTRWRGPLSALDAHGAVVPMPDEWAHVLDPAGLLDPDGELTCDWRAGDLW